MEDIAATMQRPKIEDYDDSLYANLQMLRMRSDNCFIESEQISLVLGPRYLLSFQEKPGDVFAAIHRRLRQGKGRIGKNGSDYLMYSLLDAVVDRYFVILERVEEKVAELDRRWTYPALIGIMTGIGILAVVICKRKKWF